MTAERRYRRDADDAVVVRPLDDISLLYHRPSGQTHMMVSPVPEIWAALDADAAMDVAALHDRLAQSFELGEADAAHAAIARHLEELAALGLVRRA